MDSPEGGSSYKIGVEGRLTRLETMVDEIKNNHLKHIEAKIDKAQWLAITTLIGMVITLAGVAFDLYSKVHGS